MEITKDHVRLLLAAMIVHFGGTDEFAAKVSRTRKSVTSWMSHGAIPALALLIIIKRDLIVGLTPQERKVFKAYAEHVQANIRKGTKEYWEGRLNELRAKVGITDGE